MARKVVFRGHALRRMFERSIGVEDVQAVLDSGEAVAENPGDNELIVITAYEPDAAQWEPGFKRRKP